MAAVQDIDVNQEGREKQEGQEAESLPESAEGTAELVASEDAAVSEQAELAASDLGPEGADAAAELRTDVEAEERQTMDSIAMMREATKMTADAGKTEAAERAAEAASILGRTERLDPAAAAERAQELMALAAQETDEVEKRRLMNEAWEINKQALRPEKTDESGGPAATEHEEKEPSAPDVLDSLMPEGVSDEWEALSFAGGTIEDQVKREEHAAERAVRDRINKERSEAVRNMGELQAEMKKAGVDIIKLEDILSDPDTASENLDAYDDRVLEKYRELLSRQMTTIGIGKRSLEITADDARKEMSAIEDEDRESGMATSEDGTSALARFIDVESQLDVAEDHLKEIEKDIEETDNPEKKAALEAEARDLKAHVRSLEDAGSAIIDSAGTKEQGDGFIDRIERFKTKKALLEQSLTDIEVLVGLELQSAAQADLLDAIMTEERDLSVEIEVDESGDEVIKEIPADAAADAAAAIAPDKKPAPPKKPASSGGSLTRTGSGLPTKFKEGSKDKKETLGETAKRYAKETWRDITSILNDIMKNIPGV